MTGIDGYDWASVGWSNPVPGDPDVARQIGGQLQDLADDVSQQNFLLSSVGPDSAGVWSGPAASAFRPIAEKLPPELTKLITSYQDAASAINGYWPRHLAAQNLAVQALAKAQAADQAIASAQQQIGSLQGQSSAAASAYNKASSAASNPPAGSTPNPNAAADVANLQTQYRAVQGQLGTAQGELGSAQGNFGAAEGMRQQAIAEWNGAVSNLVGQLKDASNAGIHNVHRGFFGSITHAVSSLMSSGAHGLESFAKGQVDAIVHQGEDIAHDAVSLGNDVAGAASAAYGATAAWAKANMGVLKDVDSALNDVSTVLGTLAIICQPIPGLDAVVDVVSDGVLVLKTADDGLELMGGDSAAEAELIEDGVGLATAGTANVLDGLSDDATEAARIAGDEKDLANEGSKAVEETTSVTKDGGDAEGAAGRTDDQDVAGAGGSTSSGDGSGDDGSGDDGSGDDGSGDDRSAVGADDGGAGGSNDGDGEPAEAPPAGDRQPGDSTGAGSEGGDPTPAGSDDGQMPAREPVPSTSGGDPSAPNAEAAPKPSESAPADAKAGSDPKPSTPEAPPLGKIKTAVGGRDFQKIAQLRKTKQLFKVMDDDNAPTTYFKGMASSLRATTHGRFAVARTLMTVREANEAIHDDEKMIRAWTGHHADDDKIDWSFAEKVGLGE